MATTASVAAEPVAKRRGRVPLPPKLRKPGWYRAALFDVLGLGFAFGLTVLIRWLMHEHPVIDGDAITIVALIAVPLFFMVGLGTADYWFYWAAGKRTRPEDHSAHGARTWRDYFRVNTDHKVIGIQYTVTSFFFLFVGGLLAMLIRVQLAKPGMQFLTPEQYNGVFSVHATLLIFLFVIPVFAGLAHFVLFDRALGFHFFDAFVGAGKNGNVLMYQHVFWFYSHPAVYIMMLPGFGIISEIIATKSRKPIFGYRMMAFSLIAIVVLGFTVWAHHMFVSGMQPWIRIPMMITTAIIAIPTGIKIFSWLATLWRGVLHLDTPMLFALGFLTMFTLGGISGVMLAMIPFDIHVSQTYFIVAHIHYVLFGGSLFTIFAGVYYWFPKMTGRMFDDRLGKLHFWLTFIFFNLTFGPMHLIGIQGMPRRGAEC